jgi:hypothetical protein
MTVREAWEEVSFQVFTDMGGVLRSGFYPTGEGIVTGNVQVDRVWGNMPMQPNDDRTDTYTEIGGGEGDNGYDSTFTISSDTLRTADYNVTVNNVGLQYKTPADSHTIATDGYSNFPAFIPNYAGDEDSGAEVVVPNLVGKAVSAAADLLDGLVLGMTTTTVVPLVQSVVTSTTTVSVTVDNAYNLKKNDNVYFDSVIVGTTPVAFGNITLTGVTGNVLKFANEGEYELNDEASGNVWGASSSSIRVISQDPAAGDIVDVESDVELTILYVD